MKSFAEAKKGFELRRKQLEEERQSWWNQWQDLSEYISPTHGRFLVSDNAANDGSYKYGDIINAMVSEAAGILEAGLYTGMTSPAKPWLRLGLPDRDLMKYKPVKRWLENVRTLMLYVFAKSNVYRSLRNVYHELGVFGTGAMLVLEDYDTVIRCRPFTIGEYSAAQSPQYRVDSIYRTYKMTTQQMIDEFGEDNVSEAVKQANGHNSSERWWDIVHLIEPNNDRVPDMKDARNMPWRSVYYEQNGERERLARVSGFEQFPGMVPRWAVTGTNIYGNSPGMMSLGDGKMLQSMEKKSIKGVDLETDPPMVANSDLRDSPVNGMPGGITYTDETSGQPQLRKLYDGINFDIAGVENKIARVEERLQRYFHVPLFLDINRQAGTPATATEIAIRHERALLMLGPVLENVQEELLDPMVDRTFEIMQKAGIVPPPPPEIGGMDLKVEYIGLLAQAQKMVRTASVEQGLAFAANLSGVLPETLDNIDGDNMLRGYFDMIGMPTDNTKDPDEVKVKRQARAKKQQAAEQMGQAQVMAEGAKNLSETSMDENSALDAILGGGM